MDATSATGAAQFQMQYATKIGSMVKDQREAEGQMVNQMIQSTPGNQQTSEPSGSTGQNISVRV